MVEGLTNGVTQSLAMQFAQIAQTTQRYASTTQAGIPEAIPSALTALGNAQQSPVVSNAEQQVNQLKQQLDGSQYTVEFDTKSHAQRGWLNIVEKSTGQVVYKIPPEQIRRWVENNSGTALGLSVDSKG